MGTLRACLLQGDFPHRIYPVPGTDGQNCFIAQSAMTVMSGRMYVNAWIWFKTYDHTWSYIHNSMNHQTANFCCCLSEHRQTLHMKRFHWRYEIPQKPFLAVKIFSRVIFKLRNLPLAPFHRVPINTTFRTVFFMMLTLFNIRNEKQEGKTHVHVQAEPCILRHNPFVPHILILIDMDFHAVLLIKWHACLRSVADDVTWVSM